MGQLSGFVASINQCEASFTQQKLKAYPFEMAF